MKLWIGAIVIAAGIATAAQARSAEDEARPQKSMRLWYQTPAADSVQGWLDQSLPLGNGYFGVNVFGGVARERLQITENSLVDMPADGIGGLNNFAEVGLEFPHAAPQQYRRDLDLNTATAHVSYSQAGVGFTREYFASYPDRVLVIRLTASRRGALDFTLRPKAPYLAPFRKTEGDRRGKQASVNASGDLITLKGVMDYYGVKFEAQFKVIAKGGSLRANNGPDGAAITVHGADSAVILVALGTNYRLDPQVFSQKDPLKKLAGFPDPHALVTKTLAAATRLSFETLKARHEADYTALYGRVDFDLGEPASPQPTDQRLQAARDGQASPYLDALAFQYGRYLLISSSRKRALPPNLQGVWNVYQDAPWSAGYWHNVNQQMNYWPAFVGNLPELFESYLDFYKAYLPAHQERATQYLKQYHPEGLSATGDNGWALGNSMRPFEPSGKVAHSGFGTGPWTTMLFWDFYDYTRDRAALRDIVFPAMRGQADFLSRFLTDRDGKLLAAPSSSPENAASLQSVGTTFDQQMIYENFRDTITAASLLGVKNDPVVSKIADQIDKLDPILIGDSGQIKEYREETTYGSIGDPAHRHISQLLGVYPGRLINRQTPAWQDAARVSLHGRGLVGGTGWSQAERIETWARLGDGDLAYQFYRYWMSHHAMANLWNNHRDSLTTRLFQVDGNFGVSAGVGEMLLQSADGVVAPLAALPSAWPEGHYRGLLARGAFEVSADWSHGHADRLSVHSKAGGPLTLRYPGIALAKLRNADGADVTARADGRDDISFDTDPGATYVVTSIPAVAPAAPIKDLAITVDAGDALALTWRADPALKAYAVERAADNAPAYTEIASGLVAPRYVDRDEAIRSAGHLRYRVVGLTADGSRAVSPGVFRDRPQPGAQRFLGVDDDLVGYGSGDGALKGVAMSGGRYQVDLTWSQGNLTAVRLTSASDGAIRLRSPMLTGPIEILHDGKAVPRVPEAGAVTLMAKAGDSFDLRATALVSLSTQAASTPGRADVAITVRALARPLAASTLTLQPPKGWLAEPQTITLPRLAAGRSAIARFEVAAPKGVTDGRYAVKTTRTGADGVLSSVGTVELGLPNLALGRPARQSSTVRGEGADRAVDGRTLAQIEAGSVTSTEVEDAPWWEVDLGQSRSIGDIVLWPRTDTCCSTPIADLVLLVSDTALEGLALSEATKRADIAVYRFKSDGASAKAAVERQGRYVRIWSTKRQELNLAEVQVFPSLGR